jgi:hypothetical protein
MALARRGGWCLFSTWTVLIAVTRRRCVAVAAGWSARNSASTDGCVGSARWSHASHQSENSAHQNDLQRPTRSPVVRERARNKRKQV